ncbi:hypothetical protein PISS_a3539 [Pseudoalteromonas issachenkonii]|uniref:Uncharacterized protein n=1 Tax=Pseudoalteromonas issachenkonii TaxID=152297 RepID=A0ABM6N7R0_9GAMM|nr:hypothetical protein PISS_a3539 [Pseudoalteromonas issachenkonii]
MGFFVPLTNYFSLFVNKLIVMANISSLLLISTQDPRYNNPILLGVILLKLRFSSHCLAY